MKNNVSPSLIVTFFQINRDTPIREFELNREFSTFGLELVLSAEIDQYIRFFDVQVEDFLFVHIFERFTDLAEDDEGGGLIVRLSEG